MSRTVVRPSSEDGATGRRTAPTRHTTKAADDQDRDKAGGDGDDLHRRSDRHRSRRERHPALNGRVKTGQYDQLVILAGFDPSTEVQRPHFNDRNTHHKSSAGTRATNRRRTGHRAGHSSTVATMEIASIRTPRPLGAGKPNDRDRAQSEHAAAARNRHRQTAPSRTRSTHDERRSGTRERARRCDIDRIRKYPWRIGRSGRISTTLLEETHEHVEKTVCPIPMLNRRPRPRKPTTRRGPQHTHPARRLPPPGRPDGGRPPALPCRPTRRWSCMPGAAPDSQRTRRCANRQPCARRPTNRNVTSP